MNLGLEDWLLILADNHPEYPRGVSDELRAEALKTVRREFHLLRKSRGSARVLGQILRNNGCEVGSGQIVVSGVELVNGIEALLEKPQHPKTKRHGR